jgi:lycopene beta-cyclase
MKHYDYIFTGAGLSALMTVYKMVQSGSFTDKSILLLDENTKKTTELGVSGKLTIHFWEHLFQKNGILFANENFRRDLDLQPYHYNMVKGLDFLQTVSIFSKQANITFINQKVLEIEESETIILYKRKNPFRVLNYSTVFTTNKAENQTKYPVLQQHFIGWFIKSEQAVFNMEQATFMDFSVKGNTVLCTCCLPLKTEALLNTPCFRTSI